MTLSLFHVLGGLGLFLLGMSVMTQALRALADERMRSLLHRFTKSPTSGVITGAVTTALVQSSSATTVAAVGFVEAGLLEFSQALGVIFGANIGTTITGWLVALFGFKLKIGDLLLPVLFAGVLMRLIGRPRLSSVGSALAGFGMVFIGIGLLQDGMEAARDVVTPESFPPDTIGGRLLLVLIGLAVTVVTQSSSAGVATVLVAVNTGAITLPQAAAMVIGMDLGTTVTAVLATIGGKVAARRTGFAHVIYNMMTATGAFLLLTPCLAAVDAIWPGFQASDPEIALVAFHTFYNTLGVLVVLPFTGRFAGMLVRLFPDRGNPLTRRLEPMLLSTPRMALDAVESTLHDVSRDVLNSLVSQLNPDSETHEIDLSMAEDAIRDCGEYVGKLNVSRLDSPEHERYLGALHVLDHLRRLVRRLQQRHRVRWCRADSHLSAMSDTLLAAVGQMSPDLTPSHGTVESIRGVNQQLKRSMKAYRTSTLERAARGEVSTASAERRMDTARWLRRVGYHLWRIVFHLLKGPDTTNGPRLEQHADPK